VRNGRQRCLEIWPAFQPASATSASRQIQVDRSPLQRRALKAGLKENFVVAVLARASIIG
jgi:hypothetical protein